MDKETIICILKNSGIIRDEELIINIENLDEVAEMIIKVK